MYPWESCPERTGTFTRGFTAPSGSMRRSDEDKIFTSEGDALPFSERLRYRRDELCAGLFKAVGTPYSEGGSFQTRMAPDSPPMAVINEAMARQLWLGVVGDMRRQGVERFDPTTDV